MDDKQAIAAATVAIFEIVRRLPGPRDAAKALAGAHVLLIEAEGVDSEAAVRARLNDSVNGIVESWRDRAGVSPLQ